MYREHHAPSSPRGVVSIRETEGGGFIVSTFRGTMESGPFGETREWAAIDVPGLLKIIGDLYAEDGRLAPPPWRPVTGSKVVWNTPDTRDFVEGVDYEVLARGLGDATLLLRGKSGPAWAAIAAVKPAPEQAPPCGAIGEHELAHPRLLLGRTVVWLGGWGEVERFECVRDTAGASTLQLYVRDRNAFRHWVPSHRVTHIAPIIAPPTGD